MSEAAYPQPRIFAAINAISRDLAAVGIGKDSRNKEQGFQYRGIDAVMNTLAPLFVKHKVFVVPSFSGRTVTERPTRSGGIMFNVVVSATFRFVSAEDGTEIQAVTIGEGQDSADKATNKAMAISYKYAVFQLFCIPLEPTADPDADAHEETHREPDPTKGNLSDLVQEFDLRSLEATSLKELADMFATAQAELKKAAVDRECQKSILIDSLGAVTKGKDKAKERLTKRPAATTEGKPA
jgi:hypothetical protein